jgi:Na+/H+ antiporter NhaA
VHIVVLCYLGSIGLTITMFAASCTFAETALISTAKINIRFFAVIGGLSGYFILRKHFLINNKI